MRELNKKNNVTVQFPCPRCGELVEIGSPYVGYIGNGEEGSICGECWTQDRYAEWIKNTHNSYNSKNLK